MKVKFVEHSKERMIARGASEAEVERVLLSGTDIPARKGRNDKEMTLSMANIGSEGFTTEEGCVILC
jgi:hypothetical protein